MFDLCCYVLASLYISIYGEAFILLGYVSHSVILYFVLNKAGINLHSCPSDYTTSVMRINTKIICKFCVFIIKLKIQIL